VLAGSLLGPHVTPNEAGAIGQLLDTGIFDLCYPQVCYLNLGGLAFDPSLEKPVFVQRNLARAPGSLECFDDDGFLVQVVGLNEVVGGNLLVRAVPEPSTGLLFEIGCLSFTTGMRRWAGART